MLNGTNLGLANLPLGNGDFSPAFNIAGFTAVGSGFMLIAERVTPSGSGDLALLSYPSLADMLNGTNLGLANLPLGNGDFSPAFDIAGFTADGSGFMLIAERVTPSGSGDLALLSYPSLADMLNGTNLGLANLPLGNGDFSPAFNIAGFDIASDSRTPVSEPPSLALLMVGLCCAAFRVRRRPQTS
jgi:hypothetical protein